MIAQSIIIIIIVAKTDNPTINPTWVCFCIMEVSVVEVVAAVVEAAI